MSFLPDRCFVWLPTQDPLWLIALKARLLVECGVDRGGDLGLVGRLLVVHFPGHGGPQRDYLAGVCMDQQQVLLRMGFLLAAVRRYGLAGVRRTLAAARGPVQDPSGGTLSREGMGGDPARVAFRRHVKSGSGAWQDGEQVLHPVGGR